MSSIRAIASEYKEEIQDGICYVALWKVGRSWNATTFYPDLDDDEQLIFDDPEDIAELKKIVSEDEDAVLLNACYDNLGGTSDEEDCANAKTLANFLAWQYERAQEDGRHGILTLVQSLDQNQEVEEEHELKEDKTHVITIEQTRDFMIESILAFDKLFSKLTDRIEQIHDAETYAKAIQAFEQANGFLSSWEFTLGWMGGDDEDPCYQVLEEVVEKYLTHLEHEGYVLKIMKSTYWKFEEKGAVEHWAARSLGEKGGNV